MRWPAWRKRVSAARVVWGSQPVASMRSASVAPPSRCSSPMTAGCFVGAALCPRTADAAPVSALAVAAAGARPSRRDALGRAPAVVFALLFAISPSVRHGAPRAVTATTPQSACRQRGGMAPPPLLGGRSGNANSNAPERAQVQSDLASRRRNQAPSGDPFAPNCLKGQQFDSYWLHHVVLANCPI